MGGHEGEEGCDEECRPHDDWRVPGSGGDDWLEDKAGEGPCRGLPGRGGEGVEEGRVLQGWGYDQLEIEEQARHSCAKGRQPVHQGALRLQGEAGVEESEGLCNEEA